MTASGDENEAANTGAPNSPARSEKSAAGHVMHEAVWRGNGGLEVVLMPVLTGFFGWVLDGAIGTTPIFLIIFAICGFAGSVASQYYRYAAQMNALHEARVAKRSAQQDPTAPAFGLVEADELPSYVLPSEFTGSSNALISEVVE